MTENLPKTLKHFENKSILAKEVQQEHNCPVQGRNCFNIL